MAQSAVVNRLRPYGLDAIKTQPADLELRPNQRLVLNNADGRFSKQVVKLIPKSIDDVKRWIGVPDHAFVSEAASCQACHCQEAVTPVSEAYSPEQSVSLYGQARQYIFGHSSAISKEQVPALNSWLKSISANIQVILFNDIHVATGAQLIVDASLPILVARYITIDRDGIIQMQANESRIDCVGIKGSLPPSVVINRGISALATRVNR